MVVTPDTFRCSASRLPVTFALPLAVKTLLGSGAVVPRPTLAVVPIPTVPGNPLLFQIEPEAVLLTVTIPQ